MRLSGPASCRVNGGAFLVSMPAAIFRAALALVLIIPAPQPARAEPVPGVTLYSLTGSVPPSGGNGYGSVVASLGDVNGDGIGDFGVGETYQNGSIYVYSGATGTLIYRLQGTPSEKFGSVLSGLGDVNGDGKADFLVGSPLALGGRGTVSVCSGPTGNILYTLGAQDSTDGSGRCVVGLGDLRGDGVPDFAVSSNPGGLGWGEVVVIDLFREFFGNLVADTLYTYYGGGDVGNLGMALRAGLAAPGDVNGDGTPDLVAGASTSTPGGMDHAGSVIVFSGSTGGVLYRINGTRSGMALGRLVGGGGDVDGDGHPDFIAASAVDTAEVFSGATGALLFRAQGNNSVAIAGDMNADGRAEFMVGSMYISAYNETFEASMRVLSGADGSILLDKWCDQSSVAGLGDLNGDGRSECIAGSNRTSYPGDDLGYANVYSIPPPPPTPPGCAATKDNPSNIQITWTDVSGETSYRLYRNGVLRSQPAANQTSYTDTPAQGSYVYCIKSYGPGGESPVGCCDTGIRVPYPPSSPGPCSATTQSSNFIHFSWTNVANEDGYRVYRNGTLAGTVAANNVDFIDYPAPGSYEYCVEAFNAGGASPQCCATGTLQPPPPAPGPCSATDTGTSSVTMTWTDVVGEDGYYVYRNGAPLDTLGAGATSLADSPPVGRYEYCVRAFNATYLSPACCDSGARTAGSLQFSAATYSVLESGGSVTITVTRTGTTTGTVQVSYSTVPGSASAGSDYVSSSGVLVFPDGDATPKTFTFNILEDALVEASETLDLRLSNPTGGVVLGSPNPATLTIFDNDSQARNNEPKIMVHLLSTTTKNQCTRLTAKPVCQNAVVQGNLYPQLYYAYVLVAGADAARGVAGLQFGIEYESGATDGIGVDVFAWQLCATLEFPQPGCGYSGGGWGPPDGGSGSGGRHIEQEATAGSCVWPETGGGNLITWDWTNVCQRFEPGGSGTGVVADAGYFYMTAYSPARFSITPRPADGLAKIADCAAIETVVTVNNLGSAGFGGVRGCNPCLDVTDFPPPTNCMSRISNGMITVTWGDVEGETAYYVSRDATRIAVLPANTVSFTDSTPPNYSSAYSIQSATSCEKSVPCMSQVSAVDDRWSPPGFVQMRLSANPTAAPAGIILDLPADQFVGVRVLDLSGRLVQSLGDQSFDAGQHFIRWDGRDFSGRKVSSGIYFVRAVAGSRTVTRKLVLER